MTADQVSRLRDTWRLGGSNLDHARPVGPNLKSAILFLIGAIVGGIAGLQRRETQVPEGK
jgi:hypothetical protein